MGCEAEVHREPNWQGIPQDVKGLTFFCERCRSWCTHVRPLNLTSTSGCTNFLAFPRAWSHDSDQRGSDREMG